MPVAQSVRASLYSGRTEASGTNTDTAIRVAGSSTLVKIQRIKLKRVAGGAATFTPAVFSAASATLADITQEYLGANTAVAALFDATNIDGYCRTDIDGYIYLRPGSQGGSVDNTFDYQVAVEILL